MDFRFQLSAVSYPSVLIDAPGQDDAREGGVEIPALRVLQHGARQRRRELLVVAGAPMHRDRAPGGVRRIRPPALRTGGAMRRRAGELPGHD